jgi:hypothetical protein
MLYLRINSPETDVSLTATVMHGSSMYFDYRAIFQRQISYFVDLLQNCFRSGTATPKELNWTIL